MDRLPGGLTDESDDVWMEKKFPVNCIVRKFCTEILVGIFSMNLAYGWTDGT